MSRLLLAAAVLVAAGPVRADDAFKPLFNGKDLTGWTHYLEKNGKRDDVWSVKDGVLICKGVPNGYILTEKEYGNYVLKLQWRFPAGSKGGNSGVFLHVNGPDKIWPKGVEAQLFSTRAGDFWLVDGCKMDIKESQHDPRSPRHYVRLGETYEKLTEKDKAGKGQFKLVTKPVEKPIGEWNQYEIHCTGNDIKLMVNGRLVNEGKNCEFNKGKILLQSEGAEIHFRNVEIKTMK